MKFTIAVGVLAAASCASAFVLPARTSVGVASNTVQRQATAVFGKGKYDGKVWDDDAKTDVLSTYDASQPWSDTNFDPFKKDIKGNSCDSSGYYPGQTMYKDPIRPAVTWADYQASLAKKAAKGQ